MKKFGIIFLSLLFILSFSFNAMAEEKPSNTGYYVAILGGVSIPGGMSSTVTDKTPGIGSSDLNVELKTGWLAGAKFGYLTPFTNRIIAVELEYNHIANNTDTAKTYTLYNDPTTTLDSSVKIDAFMFNVIGRYPEGKSHPYIGVGAGYANVAIDDVRGRSATMTVNCSSGSKGVFAYQFLAGIDFDITSNWFVGLGYKYFAASKASYDASITSSLYSGTHPGSIDAEYKSSIITFSVGYLF